MKRRLPFAVGLIAAGLGASPPASALLVSCAVSNTTLAFGAYDPTSIAPTSATASITVTCTPLLLGLLVSYSISLSAGGAGSYAPRQMSSGANRLNYNLYTSAALSSVWGDGSGGTATVGDSYTVALLAPVVRSYTVYGSVPARQAARAGSYTDSPVITVSY